MKSKYPNDLALTLRDFFGEFLPKVKALARTLLQVTGIASCFSCGSLQANKDAAFRFWTLRALMRNRFSLF